MTLEHDATSPSADRTRRSTEQLGPRTGPLPVITPEMLASQPSGTTATTATTAASRRRGPGRRTTALVAAAALALGGTTAAATGWLDPGRITTAASSTHSALDDSVAGTSRTSATVVPAGMTSADGVDWSGTAATVTPSVVSISVRTASGEGAGSGVILDTQGHVLTNNHVVEGAQGGTVTVTLSDNRTYEASVVGTDPSTDLAVVRLRNASDLTPIAMGDSSAAVVGQPVMAVGNPLGLSGTVTTGIVSALDRPVTTSDTTSQTGTAQSTVVTNAIQTSAAINPGNSGGALVDTRGQLIGINSAIASLSSGSGQSGSIGIGFAIPAQEAQRVAKELIADGTATHAWLGVSVGEGSAAEGSTHRLAATVQSVQDGSPAADAGLRRGDAVIAIDGEPVSGQLSLVAQIRERGADTKATLTVLRDGTRKDVDVTLTAEPS